MKELLSVMLVLGLSTVAIGQFDMAQGTATIDGNLSDWAGATWIAVDKVYSGNPWDISDGQYSARWSPVTNRIYVAVQYNDSAQGFNPSRAWNGKDGIEVYIDASNSNTSPYDGAAAFKDAQQYAVALDGTGGDFYMLCSNGGREDMLAQHAPNYAIVVNGATITYEVEMVPFLQYDGEVTGNPATSTEVALAAGLTMGLDLVISGVDTGFAFTGMACNNTVGSKYTNAGNMQDWTLVPEPASMLLLSIGGLALIRRKKA